jgi:hypothetical protein
MEANEKSTIQHAGFRRFKIILLFAAFLFAVFFIYYLAMSILASRNWVKETALAFSAEAENINLDLLSNAGFIDLEMQIAFTKARLAVASTDSIGLTVIVPDSVLLLEISGVTVSKIKLGQLNVSSGLYAIHPFLLSRMFSKPMRITASEASIVKEPIIEKIAPRDAAEAEQAETIPENLTHEPVFFELVLNDNIRLMVLQEVTGAAERKDRNRFLFNRALTKTRHDLKNLLQFQPLDYHPELRIIIPESEARAIYRALPENGNVVIRF